MNIGTSFITRLNSTPYPVLDFFNSTLYLTILTSGSSYCSLSTICINSIVRVLVGFDDPPIVNEISMYVLSFATYWGGRKLNLFVDSVIIVVTVDSPMTFAYSP